jgi:hypothetical protein
MVPTDSPIEVINATSTVVMALATVALTWFAFVQIKHRNEERAERANRLDAVARVQAMVIRRSLRVSIRALNSAGRQGEEEWPDTVSKVSGEPRLHSLTEITIERHAASPRAAEEVLRHFYRAADVVNKLAADEPYDVSDEEKARRLETARDQLGRCIKKLEEQYALPELNPITPDE